FWHPAELEFFDLRGFAPMVFDALVEHVRTDFAFDKLEGARPHHLLPIQLLAASIPAHLTLHHQVGIGRDILQELWSRLVEVKDDSMIINDLYPLFNFLRGFCPRVVFGNAHEPTPQPSVSLYGLWLGNQEDGMTHVFSRELAPFVVELYALPQRD